MVGPDTLHAVIKSLLRRIAAALVLVGSSAAVASASPLSWGGNNVSGLSLLIEIVLIPLAIGSAIALVVWTNLTARERKAGKVGTRPDDQG